MKIKQILAILLALILLLCAVSCGSQTQTTTQGGTSQPFSRTIRAYALKGPTGMGMAHLPSADAQRAFRYDLCVEASPEAMKAVILGGNYDIAAISSNVAAALYQKMSGGFSVIAVNTLGVLYLLENGTAVQSVADLQGKTIYYFGQANAPQYMLEYLLAQNHVSATLEPVSDAAALAAMLAANQTAIGMLPEPSVTSALVQAQKGGNDALRVALNLTALWQDVSGGNAPTQGCIVARTGFLQEIGASGLASLLADLRTCTEFAVSDPTAPAEIAQAEIVPSEAIARRALQNLGNNLCLLTGEDMKTQLRAFYQVLYTANPASIGGALPEDVFYAIP